MDPRPGALELRYDFVRRIKCAGVHVSSLQTHDSWTVDLWHLRRQHPPLSVNGYSDDSFSPEPKHA